MRFFSRLFHGIATFSWILLFWGTMTVASLIVIIANEQTVNRFGDRCEAQYPDSIDSIVMQLEFEHYVTSLECNTLIIEGFVPKNYTIQQYQAIVIKLAILAHAQGIYQPIEVILSGDYTAFARLTSTSAITFVAHPTHVS